MKFLVFVCVVLTIVTAAKNKKKTTTVGAEAVTEASDAHRGFHRGFGQYEHQRGEGQVREWGHQIPSWMKNVTEEQKDEAKKIFQDETLTKSEKKEKLGALAAEIGDEAVATFNEFTANMTKWRKDAIDNRTAILTALPAKMAELDQINESDVTKNEADEKRKAFFDSIEDPKLAAAVRFFSQCGSSRDSTRVSTRDSARNQMIRNFEGHHSALRNKFAGKSADTA